MNGWQVDEAPPGVLPPLLYIGEDGKITASIMTDSMLLIGFHNQESRTKIWDDLCAAVRGPQPQPVADTSGVFTLEPGVMPRRADAVNCYSPGDGETVYIAFRVDGEWEDVIVSLDDGDHLQGMLYLLCAPHRRPVAEVSAESLARLFHETYERLAPEYGYETRKASAVPWEQVPENNRALMTAVAAEVLKVFPVDREEADGERSEE